MRHSAAEPQPKERGQPCPREGGLGEETRGQGGPPITQITEKAIEIRVAANLQPSTCNLQPLRDDTGFAAAPGMVCGQAVHKPRRKVNNFHLSFVTVVAMIKVL
jgi:hypothetical protein